MEKPFIIGITGGSGSGKTSFIREIRKAFSTEEVCILSMDDYYKPRELQVVDKEGIKNFDLPKSIDKKQFHQDLEKLMRFEQVTKQEYTFNNEKKEASVLTFFPAPVIIVEGLFVFHYKKIRNLLDLKVFLHAKENLKVIRRIKRDQTERNYPLEDVLYRYERHVLPTFEKFIKPYQEEADLVIINNNHFKMGLEVVKGFIKTKIQQA